MGRGRPGGNPEVMAKPLYEKAMSRKMLGLRLPVDIDEYVRSLPNRAEWLREAVLEKIEREKNFNP